MSESPLQIEAILDSIATRKDKSVKIVFETNEVNAEECSRLFSMRDEFGWLSFSKHKRNKIELPKIGVSKELEGKTPSQRLRSVLFVYWQQLGSSGDFQSFYELQVNRLIEKVKEKLI